LRIDRISSRLRIGASAAASFVVVIRTIFRSSACSG
jgi:hypothetical protein